MLKFDTYVDNRAGVIHQDADVLLQLPTEVTDKTSLEDNLPVMFIHEIHNVKHDCPQYVLKDIFSILMHVNSEEISFKTPPFVEFIKDQSGDVYVTVERKFHLTLGL